MSKQRSAIITVAAFPSTSSWMRPTKSRASANWNSSAIAMRQPATNPSRRTTTVASGSKPSVHGWASCTIPHTGMDRVACFDAASQAEIGDYTAVMEAYAREVEAHARSKKRAAKAEAKAAKAGAKAKAAAEARALAE